MADKKREKEKSLENAGLAGAQAETVQRYGSAVKEHFVSYSGMDNEAQAKLTKGLKQISESKVDPNNPEISIKQQAGFSAEVKTQARESAEKIIAGEKNKAARITTTYPIFNIDNTGRANISSHCLFSIREKRSR